MPDEKGSYWFDLRALRQDYQKYSTMTPTQIKKNLAGLAHFACIVSYYKNVPSEHVIGDTGIVHEIVHLLHDPEITPDEEKASLRNIRKKVKKYLSL